MNMEKRCDICDTRCHSIFYDAKMKQGPWANMCSFCFQFLGVGLGTGRGQKYVSQGNDWIKVEG